MSSVRERVSDSRERTALGALTAGLVIVTVAACAGGATGQPGSQVGLQRKYEAIIAKALPSVVEITAGKATGSGVVFDRHGDIVTNAQVVGTVKTFRVRVPVDSHPLKARLVGVFTAALEDALVSYQPGEQVKLEVLRNGNPRQFTVTLASLTG